MNRRSVLGGIAVALAGLMTTKVSLSAPGRTVSPHSRLAQHTTPNYLLAYSAITIADRDAGITRITYTDTVEETVPKGPHKEVLFNFGYGPVPGYYVASIQAEGAVIPDGCDVQVSYRPQGDKDIMCDTLRNVRQVRPGEYVCDWIYWDGMRPFGEAPKLHEEITIQGKTFELAGPIKFNGDRVCFEIALRRQHFADFMAVQENLVNKLSERRPVDVEAAALTAKGISQLVFVSKSIPVHRLRGDFVVRLEGMLLSAVDDLLRAVTRRQDEEATKD